jgi:hypothetical protein
MGVYGVRSWGRLHECLCAIIGAGYHIYHGALRTFHEKAAKLSQSLSVRAILVQQIFTGHFASEKVVVVDISKFLLSPYDNAGCFLVAFFGFCIYNRNDSESSIYDVPVGAALNYCPDSTIWYARGLPLRLSRLVVSHPVPNAQTPFPGYAYAYACYAVCVAFHCFLVPLNPIS